MKFRSIHTILICILLTGAFHCKTAEPEAAFARKEDPGRVTETDATDSDAFDSDANTDRPVNTIDSETLRYRGAVAILPFRSQDDLQGTQFASSLLAEMKALNRFSFTERSDMDSVVKELSDSQTGLVDSDGAAKIGKLIGAKYLIMGDISVQSYTYNGSARVVNVENGAVIAAVRRSGTEDQVITHMAQALANQLSVYMAMDNPGSPYTVALKLPDDKTEFRTGETIQLEFKVISHSDRAPDRVYIQIYAIDAKGVMTLIYPNRFSGQDAIETGKPYTLPGEKADWEWVLVPPVGTEAIQAIVTERPVDYLNVLDRYSSGFPTAARSGYQSETYQAIVTRIKKEKLKDWSAGRISYELIE